MSEGTFCRVEVHISNKCLFICPPIAFTSMHLLEKMMLLEVENVARLLVSQWHANFSRLFCEFCCGLSHDICASIVIIFICRELVTNWS